MCSAAFMQLKNAVELSMSLDALEEKEVLLLCQPIPLTIQHKCRGQTFLRSRSCIQFFSVQTAFRKHKPDCGGDRFSFFDADHI
jgi:hypothetical protein